MPEQSSKQQHQGGFMHRGPGHMMIGQVKKAKDIRGTIRRLWGYLSHQVLGLIGTAVLVTVTTGIGLLGPYLMGKAIDQYILPGDVRGLLWIVFLMIITDFHCNKLALKIMI